jgi:glycosyltransferase involved in cell wall biosynthesis
LLAPRAHHQNAEKALSMMIVHLMASPFFGGPERQMLGLARHLPASYQSAFLSFAEGGACQAFLDQAHQHGFEAVALDHNSPHVLRAAREIAGHLCRLKADVLCCSGYKPDIIGWRAARRAGIPVVAVAHGWTAATLKVRLNEALDRLVLRWMDRTVCVSEAQAVKVRRAGVAPDRIVVIRNAIDAASLGKADALDTARLREFFPVPPERIVGAAGRLSPEKGFDQLVEAAAIISRSDPGVGFVLFGDGPLRAALARQVASRGLQEQFILAGFRTDLEKFLPHLHLLALPSYTEGLPVILLEALAAGVAVVATAVGGTPEVIADGVGGYLVPAGDPPALARRILDVLRDEPGRQALARRGRERVGNEFTFEVQSAAYQRLFEQLAGKRPVAGRELIPA